MSNGGSSSFAATFSPQDALADLAKQQADPNNARYTVWEIVAFESWTHSFVVDLEELS